MDYNQQTITETAGETKTLGQDFGHHVLTNNRFPKFFCLSGDLGSGKTTFTQGFAQGLGIDKRIVSPTFIIMKRYPVPKFDMWFYHIDLYRTQKPEAQTELGLTEICHNPNSIVVIEWANYLNSFPQLPYFDIKFITSENGLHKIEILMRN